VKSYEKLTQNPTAREEEVLAFWRERKTFARSLEATKGDPRYVFYEGPPTANGRPHLGHLIPRVYKDLFPRYKTMQGFYVERKGGWDTHGLPVELEVEKEIGVNSKPEIETYGVERFVERCKESVWRYKSEWERMIERMGFWIDLEDAYVTCTDDYIETLWWELKEMYDRGLLYQGHKVLPYCPRCGTGLSSHEVAQGYRTVEDPSITVRMRLVSDAGARYRAEDLKRTSLLVWTTTPWTLPANVALAVAADEVYVEVEQSRERLILAKARLGEALPGDYEIVREISGEDLVGLAYEPPYRLVDHPRAYHVYAADFVNMKEGTGIVHTAPAFGEDDYRFGQAEDLPFFHPVDLAGKFTAEFPLCTGVFVKEADATIVDDLRARGTLYRFALYAHEYPFCWRCDTPLLYYAMDSWYIKMTAVKEELVQNSEEIRWYPDHVGEGRFRDFLENLKDWALSRDRYWGTPLNLWVCEACGEKVCVGSRGELVERALDKELARVVELHRPYIDRVDLRCPECSGTMTRVPNVIDTWFDSGSMHTAQWHYPFENEEKFKESFPADFICEAMEQTRGWFYTLLATSTILHGGSAFRNCIATGLGLDENGLKMSKSKGNVIDPWTLIEQYGADCLRFYLVSSSAPWTSKRLGEADVKEPLYRFLDTLRNTYDFFALYASIDRYDPETAGWDEGDLTLLDRWILSRLASTTKTVAEALDGYDAMAATKAIEGFLDGLSNWYVRSSRRRFWKGGLGRDKVAAYTTLYEVLMSLSKLVAPFVPFIAEAIYQRLHKPSEPESVHLCRYPVAEEGRIDAALEAEMAFARAIVSLGHQARNQAQVKVRQPLRRAVVSESAAGIPLSLSEPVVALVRAELNLEALETALSLDSYLEPVPVPNFKVLGPRLGPLAPAAAAWIKAHPGRELSARLAQGPVAANLGGERVEVRPEDVTFATSLSEGFVLVDEGGVRFLLDARLDDDLREKGLVRELVHRIQNLRKEAGFEVTDRIVVRYEGDATLEKVLADNAEFISSEVLAVGMERGAPEGEFASEVVLDEGRIVFSLSRVEGK
jgi:isoleucyl-tRNA synthetase